MAQIHRRPRNFRKLFGAVRCAGNPWLAYHLRSKDGFDWKLDPGEAYTPEISTYENGKREQWYKYERIKVLQDHHGRAVQTNFGVLDVPKSDDKMDDNHGSKNLCVPLEKGRLLEIVSSGLPEKDMDVIRVKIRAEADFNPLAEVDVKSLRFGAPEEVDYARGCKPVKHEDAGRDLVVTFSSKGHGFTSNNFAAKLLGKRKDQSLLFGYARLPWSSYGEAHLTADEPALKQDGSTSRFLIGICNVGLSASAPQTVAVSLKGAERSLVFEREIPALGPYETVAVEFQAEGLTDKTDRCSLQVKSGATYLSPVLQLSLNTELNERMGPLKTPFIDRLVGEGMSFTDAHSGSAVCTPTRYGILTGRYCWRTDLKSQVLWEWGRPLIKRDRLTVAELLQQQGYQTGMIGKWHLGMTWLASEGNVANHDIQRHDSFFKKGEAAERCKAAEARIDFSRPIADGPINHGFDYYFGVDVPNFPPYLWIENDRLQGDPSVPKPSEMFGHPGPMIPGWKLEDILPSLAEKSAEWIEAQAKEDTPFFLYLPLTSPHTPIAPSERFKGKSKISDYGDFLMETDWVVGEIMGALDRANVADSTLLIFTTDNGTAPAANFRELESHGVNLKYHFTGHKRQIHEGGHRVPFIVRWPGKVAAGTSCDETICLNDLMATVAAITGAELPRNAAEDSNNILPLFLGERAFPKHSCVVNHDYQGRFAIRKGKWKLVPGKDTSLFDLDADPKESNNAAADHPELVTELAARLEEYRSKDRSVFR